MTEVQFETARAAYKKLKSAQSRLDYITRYPGGDAVQDNLGPPAEMTERHRNDYEVWARAELVKADAEFAAL